MIDPLNPPFNLAAHDHLISVGYRYLRSPFFASSSCYDIRGGEDFYAFEDHYIVALASQDKVHLGKISDLIFWTEVDRKRLMRRKNPDQSSQDYVNSVLAFARDL